MGILLKFKFLKDSSESFEIPSDSNKFWANLSKIEILLKFQKSKGTNSQERIQWKTRPMEIER